MFVAPRKDQERTAARELRKRGWSLRKIAKELGVALSSVSVWVRDISELDRIPPSKPALAGVVRLRTVPLLADPADLRRCCRCRLRKPAAAFNRRGNDRQGYCRNCFRAYFATRGDLHRKQVEVSRIRRRSGARRLIEQRRTGGCADCGLDDPIVMEFDHVGGADKTGGVAQMGWDGVALERLEVRGCLRQLSQAPHLLALAFLLAP